MMVYHCLSCLALGVVWSAGLQAPPPPAAREIVKGNGAAVQVGDIVTVNFEVRAASGKLLAGTRKRGLPYSFVFGVSPEPAVLSSAVRGMRVGGERWVSLPAAKAFGEAGVPPVVPPGAALRVHLWVVRVRERRGRG